MTQFTDFIRRRQAADRVAYAGTEVFRRLRRSGSSRPAIDLLGGVDRADLEAWNRETAQRHLAYREAIEPTAGEVAVICSSHRPDDLPNIIDAVRCQSHSELELVLVAHGSVWDVESVEAAVAQLDVSATVISRADEVSLGSCLNAAMAATDARFVAKFDSDDLYGPEYLADALRSHSFSCAGIVGKHSYFARFDNDERWLLRFPGNEFRFSRTMSGGTFLIDRDVVDDQPFPDVSLGEDRQYLARCHRRGISTFSGDRFNYTVVRSGANTWTISDQAFAQQSQLLPAAHDLSMVNL